MKEQKDSERVTFVRTTKRSTERIGEKRLNRIEKNCNRQRTLHPGGFFIGKDFFLCCLVECNAQTNSHIDIYTHAHCTLKKTVAATARKNHNMANEKI